MDITEICLECKNFFLKNGTADIHQGHYVINGGNITDTRFLTASQFFRVSGSKLNDGVYFNTPEGRAMLIDEEFDGAIWDMSVPRTFIKLCEDIAEWQKKYGGVDSASMSPFNSESFGGYSYSKSPGGANSDGTASANTWQGVFAARLRKWRRLKII